MLRVVASVTGPEGPLRCLFLCVGRALAGPIRLHRRSMLLRAGSRLCGACRHLVSRKVSGLPSFFQFERLNVARFSKYLQNLSLSYHAVLP